jgi:hypothetical protein
VFQASTIFGTEEELKVIDIVPLRKRKSNKCEITLLKATIQSVSCFYHMKVNKINQT